MTLPVELQKIRAAVREASRHAWSDLRAARPEESFYYFGLWTTGVVHRPAPTANSDEGLARIVHQYQSRGLPTTPDDLRWSEADSPYDLFGDEHFATVTELFEATGDPHTRTSPTGAELLEALVGALRDLDRDGFFGTGTDRDRVVVNVTMPGEETESVTVARARTLNPPSALRQYECDLLPD